VGKDGEMGKKKLLTMLEESHALISAIPMIDFGSSVTFNGTTSYISASKGTLTAAIGSVVCWVRCNTDWASMPEPKLIWEFIANDGFIVFAWESALGGLDLSSWTAGFAAIDNLASDPATENGGWPKANTWVHLAVTWTGSVGNPMNVKIYLDGYQLTIATPGNNNCTTIGNLRIGGDSSLGDHKSFNGYMDEFAVYGDVLTEAEIRDIYYFDTYPTDNLITRFDFDEASGTATDLSGNGNTGTLSNVTRSTTVVLNPA